MLPFPKSEGLMYMYKSMVSLCTKLDIYSDIFIKLFLKNCLLSSQGYLHIWYMDKKYLCNFLWPFFWAQQIIPL